MATLAQTTMHQTNDRPSNASENSPAVPRDTGFSEPLSKLSNTTLPHKDAVKGVGEELDMSVITERKHHHHPGLPGRGNRHQSIAIESIEAQMYNDLDVVDAEDYEKSRQEGKFKKILHKLPCTH